MTKPFTFTEPISREEIAMIADALKVYRSSSQDYLLLAERLKALNLEEGDRVSLEIARASFMTKSERLDDLQVCIEQIRENALPPSRYRKYNQREIGAALLIASNLFWKENEE